MSQTAPRNERWRVPTHLDTPDGLGPLTARQLTYLAGAGLYAGPALAALLGPVGPALGVAVPFVSNNLTLGQAGTMLATLAAAIPSLSQVTRLSSTECSRGRGITPIPGCWARPTPR